VRELAKRVGCSPSHISAIERGITKPSISTLTAVVTELNVSMESLFEARDLSRAPDRANPHADPWSREQNQPAARLTTNRPPRQGVLQRADRPKIRIESGVVAESLLSTHEDEVDFCIYAYEPGGASVADAQFIRHPGREYGMVLEGSLRVQLGFEEYNLDEGDSIAFDSTVPHRFWNDTDRVARVIWFSGSSL
jgi:transcriptional regulator with XRE-family HTH domain